MYSVDIYNHVRRACLKDGMSVREAARCFNKDRKTIGKIHFFVMSLPHSDGVFVKAYPAETTEAFCGGHISAFAFFGGTSQSILYGNTKI